MAVPADIRAVPKPTNTIVDDSGRDEPKRYAVREQSSTMNSKRLVFQSWFLNPSQRNAVALEKMLTSLP